MLLPSYTCSLQLLGVVIFTALPPPCQMCPRRSGARLGSSFCFRLLEKADKICRRVLETEEGTVVKSPGRKPFDTSIGPLCTNIWRLFLGARSSHMGLPRLVDLLGTIQLGKVSNTLELTTAYKPLDLNLFPLLDKKNSRKK